MWARTPANVRGLLGVVALLSLWCKIDQSIQLM
jgi:hypothetical protein